MPSLYKRWQVAVKQAADSAEYFEGMCAAVGPENTREWTELEERMQQERDDNIAVMDQLDVSDEQGITLNLYTVFPFFNKLSSVE